MGASKVIILITALCLVAVHGRPEKIQKRAQELLEEKRASRTSLGARLVGGNNDNEGRLEVYRYQHGWGTVCDDAFEDVDAQVACGMLGFTGGVVVSGGFGEGSGEIVMDNVECTGTERNLWNCPRSEWGEHNCGHYEDVGIRCGSGDRPKPLQIRLVGGNHNQEGRVEIRHEGQWGTVCDDGWGFTNAEVVCRSLGMTGGEPMKYAYYGEGTGPILLDSVNCLGTEGSIDECEHADWGVHDCSHSEDAGVICEVGEPEITFNIRLADGSGPHEGRVEVFHGDEWGTVCDDSWDDRDADVVCRSLGFDSGEALESNEFGSGSGTIWMDEVQCDGDESSLDQCPRNDWGDNDCGHYEDAGVICSGGESSGSGSGDDGDWIEESVSYNIRLVNGASANEGRVEILHAGEWGTVCDDSWDDTDATVVCRSLGYTSGRGLDDNEYHSGSGTIWLDEVSCTGNEVGLEHCAHNPWGEHNCSHYEDAGVICS